MGEISVELNAVSGAIKKCQTIQAGLKSESTKMLHQYDSLGNGWNDEKYRELGQIVHKCSDALKQPLSELQRCEVFLQRLYSIIAEYESIHFSNSNSLSDSDASIAGDVVLYALNSASPQVRQWRAGLNDLSTRILEYNRFIADFSCRRTEKR